MQMLLPLLLQLLLLLVLLLLPFYGPLSLTTRVSQYQKKHSPTHTYPDHQLIFISFLHLLQSIASSVFNLLAWQSFCTTSLHVLFRLLFGLAPSTSYSIYLFTKSLSSFCNTTIWTCFAVVLRLGHLILLSVSTLYLELYLLLYHHTLIWPFSSLHAEVRPHFFFYRPGLTSMQHSTSHITVVHTPPNYYSCLMAFFPGQPGKPAPEKQNHSGKTSLQTDYHASTPPLSFLQAGCRSCRPTNSVKTLKQTPSNCQWYILMVSTDTNCLNFFHPIWILASTATLASPLTFNMSPK